MSRIEEFINAFKDNTPGEDNFHQAVEETLGDALAAETRDDIWEAKIPHQIVSPDRIIQFRVTWQDEHETVHVNRAWRVQHSNALGPYKGGLRFTPDLTVDTLKFLAFEQCFKNALTGLPMGGAKGGADFDPSDKSEADIMRFCQALMMELYKYIGPDVDIPAGDINVGAREIGYMFGIYKKITNRFHGAMTGKDPGFGGSCIRREATGYGVVYFLKNALDNLNQDIKGKRCAISGAGNVARYTAEKLLQMEARVVSLSDRGGTLHFPDGLSQDDLQALHEIKGDHGSLEDFAESCNHDGCRYREDARPWDIECDIAIPAATQNELDEEDAKTLTGNNVMIVCEAANMPLTAGAKKYFNEKEILILPSKAANAGGVAVSGLERTQNAQRLSWSKDKVDRNLKDIMQDIHALCLEYGQNGKKVDYAKGANVAGFKRLSRAMMAYGVN